MNNHKIIDTFSYDQYLSRHFNYSQTAGAYELNAKYLTSPSKFDNTIFTLL